MKEEEHVSGRQSQDEEGRRAILRDTRKKMVEVKHFQINNELDEENICIGLKLKLLESKENRRGLQQC